MRESLILKLNPTNGKILDSKKIFYEQKDPRSCLGHLTDIFYHKKSRLASYLLISGAELAQRSLIATIFKQRDSKAQRLLDLSKIILDKHQAEKQRFDAQVQAQIPEEYRAWFRYPFICGRKSFETRKAGVCVFCHMNMVGVHLSVVNLQKLKILKIRSVNLLDFFTVEKIKQLTEVEVNQQEEEDGAELQWLRIMSYTISDFFMTLRQTR